MENPMTWGRAEHIVHDIIVENDRHHTAVKAGREPPRMGWSTVKQITKGLRAAGLLITEPDADGKCNACGGIMDASGCPACDPLGSGVQLPDEHDQSFCLGQSAEPGPMHALRCPAYRPGS